MKTTITIETETVAELLISVNTIRQLIIKRANAELKEADSEAFDSLPFTLYDATKGKRWMAVFSESGHGPEAQLWEPL